MKSKIVETAGYMSIALVLALTLVLSFSAIDFNSVTASAAEENVVAGTEYSVPIAPGAVLVYEDYEQELPPLWSYSDGSDLVDLSSLNLTGGIYQVVCMAYNSFGSMPLTNLLYVDFEYPHQIMCVGDYGAGDALFDVTLNLSDSILFHDSFINSFDSSEDAYVLFYALYKIEDSSSNEPITDNFFSIVGDGISFGFESIAGGITYTVDNLFFEDGNLTDFSVIIFAMTGVSLALAIIKYILRIIFSFGGIKL